jgi:hypothetical protein
MLKRPEVVFLLASALAASVPLATAQDSLANIRRCAAEPDDARRLACYDRQFRVLDANPPPAPKVAPVPPPEDPAAAERSFGMNGQVERNNPAGQPPRLQKLTGRIAATWYKAHGETVIRLENGQVWEEADGEPTITLKVGSEVTIDTGVMGAYWLLYGRSGGVRVKRTR